jgi:crotonobetainyl-CoA:carnitine CoA-transferase CaiB-like acyl-CoA transferase
MESLVWAEGIATAVWDASKKDVQRAGRSVIWGGLVSPQHWECKDGYVTFTLQASILGAADNRKLSDWMDSEQMLPDFIKGKDWSSWDWSKTTQSEMNIVIEAFSAFFKSHTMEELHTGARKRGITLYKVSTLADICKDEQLKDRDFWVNIEHDRLKSAITYPGAFARFSVSPITNWHRAPFTGEHNIPVYQRELGLSEEETRSLERDGII